MVLFENLQIMIWYDLYKRFQKNKLIHEMSFLNNSYVKN